MSYLAFIDTNIFLDFYRYPSSASGQIPSLLQKLLDHRDLIITSDQVYMEYLKNRGMVIRDYFKDKIASKDVSNIFEASEFNDKEPFSKKFGNGSISSIISESEIIKEALDEVKKTKALINQIEAKKKKTYEEVVKIFHMILENPETNDPVFIGLMPFFKDENDLNLTRSRDERLAIRKLAKKRFLLGYPPRKNDDNSIGDSINWEWIISCAIKFQKNIIIVSRDSDYGTQFEIKPEPKYFLNDWLKKEFDERVGNGLSLLLTPSLTKAFEFLEIQVSDEEKQVEGLIQEENVLQNEIVLNRADLSQIPINNFYEKLDASIKILSTKEFQSRLNKAVELYIQAMKNIALAASKFQIQNPSLSQSKNISEANNSKESEDTLSDKEATGEDSE